MNATWDFNFDMLYLQFYTPNCNFTISQKTKKIVPCLGLLQNKSCVCVGGILWIQGQSKNGPAMVFFWVEILQIVLTKVCKNFNQIRQFTFRQRRPFIFFMKWEEVAIT